MTFGEMSALAGRPEGCSMGRRGGNQREAKMAAGHDGGGIKPDAQQDAKPNIVLVINGRNHG